MEPKEEETTDGSQDPTPGEGHSPGGPSETTPVFGESEAGPEPEQMLSTRTFVDPDFSTDRGR
jgi:hypothetical protein